MKRRALLASAAGVPITASSGCLDRVERLVDGEKCSSFTFDWANVDVDYWCDAGTALSLSTGGSSEHCSGELVLEVVSDGDVVQRTTDTGDGSWHFEIENTAGTPSPGDVLLRCRRPEGRVLATKGITVDHYRDEPGLRIDELRARGELISMVDPPSLSVRTGEPVPIGFTIGNMGGPASFTAVLLVDGESVDKRSGTVEGDADCGAPSGPEVAFSPEFDRTGSYELAVRLDANGEKTDREVIATMTVEHSSN